MRELGIINQEMACLPNTYGEYVPVGERVWFEMYVGRKILLYNDAQGNVR
jgi:hypothetical protein